MRRHRNSKRYWCYAMKDGKSYCTEIRAFSAKQAKEWAEKVYPAKDGYTDHTGVIRAELYS